VLLLDLMREIDEAHRNGTSLGGDTGDIVLPDARESSLPPPSKPVEIAVELPVEMPLRPKRSSAWPVLLTVPLAIAAFYLASEPPVRSEQPKRRPVIARVEVPAPPPVEEVAEVAEEIAVAPVEVVIEPPPPRAPKPSKKKRPKIEPEVVEAPPPEPLPEPPPEEPKQVEPPLVLPVEPPPPVIAPPAPPPPRPAPQPAPLTTAERGKHELTAKKCGKCHTASYVFDGIAHGKTPITGQPFHAEEIKRQVVRCTRLPHSNISKDEAREILAYLVSARKK
jgi:hypothetical protein